MSQPMPRGGKTMIIEALRQEFETLSERQYRKGIDTYGTPLLAHNGRDAGQDAAEEWFDLGMYLTQLRVENADLKAELARLKGQTP